MCQALSRASSASDGVQGITRLLLQTGTESLQHRVFGHRHAEDDGFQVHAVKTKPTSSVNTVSGCCILLVRQAGKGILLLASATGCCLPPLGMCLSADSSASHKRGRLTFFALF
jgi:hypothetical protein